MRKDILEQLFVELFEVNHLTLDLIDEIGNTKLGNEILIKFYKKTIVEDLTKEELLNHKNKVSYSCLGTLSKSELDNFLENLYS